MQNFVNLVNYRRPDFFAYWEPPKTGALKNKIKISLLFDIVNRDGKVVPRSLVDGRRPDLPVAPVENLERVAGQLRLA